MNSTKYVIGFILVLTSVVAIMLTGLREVTKEQAAQNEDVFNKRAILLAVEDHLGGDKKVSDLSDDEVKVLFEKQVDQKVLDAAGEEIDGVQADKVDMAKEKKKPLEERQLPLFIYSSDEGEKFYIVSVRGNGLWDEIWGNIALQSDLNTVTGAAFDHKGETPGLGAEIKDNPSFRKQFKGKQIYDEGEYVSVTVRKGGAKDKDHEVDGISGATVTADGVTDMLYDGIKNYEPYFNKIREANQTSSLLK